MNWLTSSSIVALRTATRPWWCRGPEPESGRFQPSWVGMILHALSCKICDLILDLGMTPPVLVSGNIDDGEEYDEKDVESFKEFIGHL